VQSKKINGFAIENVAAGQQSCNFPLAFLHLLHSTLSFLTSDNDSVDSRIILKLNQSFFSSSEKSCAKLMLRICFQSNPMLGEENKWKGNQIKGSSIAQATIKLLNVEC